MSDVTTPIEILLIEDDLGDALMAREAFEGRTEARRLTIIRDGESAVKYLRKQGEHAAAVTPDLILLDLNLPRMDGREVLAEIKADPRLRSIPVVILTTSEAEDDVARSYALHANAYVTKPRDFDDFTEILRRIDEFFTTVVRLPRR